MKVARPKTEKYHNWQYWGGGKRNYFKKGFWKRYDRKRFFRKLFTNQPAPDGIRW